jgi:hypothetical protein
MHGQENAHYGAGGAKGSAASAQPAHGACQIW